MPPTLQKRDRTSEKDLIARAKSRNMSKGIVPPETKTVADPKRWVSMADDAHDKVDEKVLERDRRAGAERAMGQVRRYADQQGVDPVEVGFQKAQQVQRPKAIPGGMEMESVARKLKPDVTAWQKWRGSGR